MEGVPGNAFPPLKLVILVVINRIITRGCFSHLNLKKKKKSSTIPLLLVLDENMNEINTTNFKTEDQLFKWPDGSAFN
jgi:hypothetical protein